MVNEVDTTGNVVRLTSLQPLTPPSDPVEQPPRPKPAALGSENGTAEPAEGAQLGFFGPRHGLVEALQRNRQMPRLVGDAEEHDAEC